MRLSMSYSYYVGGLFLGPSCFKQNLFANYYNAETIKDYNSIPHKSIKKHSVMTPNTEKMSAFA